MHKLKIVFIAIFWALATTLPLLLFASPWFVVVPAIVFSLWMVRRGKRAEITLLIGSLLFTFACVEIMIRIMADDVFYREHERFAKYGRYLPNIHTTVNVAHGDMVAMDPRAKVLASPHKVRFETDADGFRNSKDYQNEPYVLLGDSFVAGVGNSAPDTLASQINRMNPDRVYSLGYPGEPEDYQNRALDFLHSHPESKAKFIWFLYEGNDLVAADAKVKPAKPAGSVERLAKKISVRELPLLAPRFLTILYKRIGAMVKKSDHNSPVVLRAVNGMDMAFYQPYIDIVKHGALKLNLTLDPALIERTACVFIIPDKYRVYHDWIADESPLPNTLASVKAIETFFAPLHIPVKDLGKAMQLAAREGLEKKEFIYWTDDTHWNAQGIHVAAEETLSCINP